MDDPRVAAKLKLLDEILAFASAGSADGLKAKYAPTDEASESPTDEAVEPAADDESLPPPDAQDPEASVEGLSEEDLKKLIGG